MLAIIHIAYLYMKKMQINKLLLCLTKYFDVTDNLELNYDN